MTMKISDTTFAFPLYLSAAEMALEREYLEGVSELLQHLHDLTAAPFPINYDLEICKKAVEK